MSCTRRRIIRAVTVGAAAVLALIAFPARAGGPVTHDESLANTASSPSRDGVDFDAACVSSTSPPPGRALNWLASPVPGGPTQGTDCTSQGVGSSLYDGSTETLDLNSASLASGSPSGWYTASWSIDGALPSPGSTTSPFTMPSAGGAPDLPNNTFSGGGFYALFQNKDKQHRVDNTASGCTGFPPPRLPDEHGHWADGYHFFGNVSFDWNGSAWSWRAAIGEYDPSPGGGFHSTELGTNQAGSWVETDMAFPYGPAASGGKWTVTVTGTTVTLAFHGRHSSTNSQCVGGVFITDYGSNSPGPFSGPAGSPMAVRTNDASCGAAYMGDCIRNVKFLTTAKRLGVESFVDTTSGTSTAGTGNTNPTGSAYSVGLLGGSDTLGPNLCSPNNEPCHNDDDPFSRGSFYPEWWETSLGFTF